MGIGIYVWWKSKKILAKYAAEIEAEEKLRQIEQGDQTNLSSDKEKNDSNAEETQRLLT